MEYLDSLHGSIAYVAYMGSTDVGDDGYMHRCTYAHSLHRVGVPEPNSCNAQRPLMQSVPCN
jgi:hypothetical protein